MHFFNTLKILSNIYYCPIYFGFEGRYSLFQSTSNFSRGGKYRARSASPFFDHDYYYQASPDVAKSNLDPVSHYLNYGWRELRSPSPYFDAKGFSDAHPHFNVPQFDLAEVCMRLYGSYAWKVDGNIASVALSDGPRALTRFSWRDRSALFKKWRRYQSFFDPDFYIQEYPEAASTPMEAFAHYMHKGFSEDRQPRPDFDGHHYRKSNGLCRAQNPFRHCVDKIGRDDTFPVNTDSRYLLPYPENFNHEMSLCIHIHCFYIELLDEIIEHLRNINIRYCLVVTVSTKDAALAVAEKTSNALINIELHILIVQNRGRDIAPFLVDASKVWRNFDIVLHLHTKKSPHISWGDNWRRYILKQTIGSNSTLEKVIDVFNEKPQMGVVYPENYCMIRHFTEREKNSAGIDFVAKMLKLHSTFHTGSAYPAGSMAFYRVKALSSLLDHEILKDLFEKEQGQLDGTAAHALERLLPEVVRQHGYEDQIYIAE